VFTGIIQALGTVSEVGSDRLAISAPTDFAPQGYDEGESIAVNGCCLTVVESRDDLVFDVSPETWLRTSLGSLRSGMVVNLERAMLASSRFGGHIVQGHVDATGCIVGRSSQGEFDVFRIQGPREYDRYLIDKGSVSVDGISLTVVNPAEGAFEVWIIPHTLERTNLHQKTIGDPVNLEYDVLAKHIEKLFEARN
jgi:riboflavin synthase